MSPPFPHMTTLKLQIILRPVCRVGLTSYLLIEMAYITSIERLYIYDDPWQFYAGDNVTIKRNAHADFNIPQLLVSLFRYLLQHMQT